MEFELTEEQRQVKVSVREFAEAEIAPHVMEWDEAQHFPIELQPKLAELCGRASAVNSGVNCDRSKRQTQSAVRRGQL